MKKKKADRMYLLFYFVIAALCICLLLVRAVLHPISVVGSSMSPTYVDGEILSTTSFNPEKDPVKINDIIVFTQGDYGKHLIKRVVALEGDTVQSIDGLLYVNDELVDDSFPQMEDAGCISSKYTVPKGSVFVLGDNRNHSTDSREFGAISVNSITGIVSSTLIDKD